MLGSWRKLFVIGSLVVLFGMLIVRLSRAPEVSVATVHRASVPVTFSATGFVEATEVTITSKVTGRVAKIAVEEGDAVRKGDTLIVLEPDEYRAAFAGAAANREIANNHASAASLHALASLRAAPLQVQQAEAAVREAEAQLAKLRRGSRPEEIREARAALEEAASRVKLAQAQLTAAEVALEQQRRLSKAQVDQAEAALQAARASEQETVTGARKQEIAQAESALQEARTRRELAQKDFDRLAQLFAQGAISRQALDHAETTLHVSEQVEKQANERLSLLREGAREEARRVASAQVEAAEAKLREAQAAAELVGVRQAEVEAARQQLKQAEASLQAAKARTEIVEKGPRVEDISAARARYAEAQSGLALARQSLIRATAQRAEANAALAQARQAAANQRQASIQLSETVIRSPIDGVVTKRMVDVGELVTPTTPLLPGSELLKIVDLRTTWVVAEVDAADIGKVFVGQPVEISAEGYPGRIFRGWVERIANSAEPKPGGRTRARIVRAKIHLAESYKELKPGLEVDVRARRIVASDVLTIPRDALIKEENATFVFVLEGSFVRRRKVTPGVDNGLTVQVISGLREGEKVVVHGKEGLTSGKRVKVAKR